MQGARDAIHKTVKEEPCPIMKTRYLFISSAPRGASGILLRQAGTLDPESLCAHYAKCTPL